MNESTIQTAVSRLRDKAIRPPRNIALEHRPPLLSFSEWIARSKGNGQPLPESIRIANRKLAEQMNNDAAIDYCYAEIPVSADVDTKAAAVDQISTMIGDFTGMGDVLVFAICVQPE